MSRVSEGLRNAGGTTVLFELILRYIFVLKHRLGQDAFVVRNQGGHL